MICFFVWLELPAFNTACLLSSLSHMMDGLLNLGNRSPASLLNKSMARLGSVVLVLVMWTLSLLISLLVKGAYWMSCKPISLQWSQGQGQRGGHLSLLVKRLLNFLILVLLVCLKVFSLDCIKKLLICAFTLSLREFLREFLLVLISLFRYSIFGGSP